MESGRTRKVLAVLLLFLAVAPPVLPIRATSAPTESGTVTPTPAAPAGSADGGVAAATTATEVAAVDAVAEMTEHLTVAGPVELGADGKVYSCKHCSTHLGLADDILSKGFQSNNEKAYLFTKVVNVIVGAKEDRMMITGMYTVSDIFCAICGRTVGWKYESAHEESQKYKEGKFILERYMLSGPDGSEGSVTDEDDADDANASPVELDADGKIYSCKHCSTHLGLADDIFSKDFYCKNGKAYLFTKVVNVTVGAKEDRMLITGVHTISDIFCAGCGRTVGWKYESAHKESQKYKEGKFILERYMLSGPDGSNGSVTDEDDAHVRGSTVDDA